MNIKEQELNRIFEEQWKHSLPDKKQYLQMLDYARATKLPLAYACVYFYRTTLCVDSNINELMKNATKALHYAEKANHNLWIKKYTYNILGVAACKHGNNLSAVDYFWKVKECLMEDGSENQGVYINVYVNIGFILNSLGDPKAALAYFKAAQKYLNKSEYYNVKKQMILYINFMKCYYYMNNLRATKNLIGKAEKLLSNHIEILDLYMPYAVIRYQVKSALGSYPDAASELMEILKSKPYFESIDIFTKLFEELLIKKEFALYQQVLNCIEKYKEEVKNEWTNLKLLEYKINYYEALGQTDLIYDLYEEYYYLSEKLSRDEREFQLHSLKAYIDAKEKEKQHKEFERKQELLRRKSDYDELTGLPNRYRLNEFCNDIFSKAFQEHKTVSVEIIDIDYFKQYNDTFGHIAGDKCLCMIADAIQLFISENELAARYGGDEFLIVRTGKTNQELMCQAEELKTYIQELGIAHPDSLVSNTVTVSQGIMNSVPKEGEALRDFLRAADQALYDVKKKKRNAISFYK